MSGWKRVPLGEACIKITDGTHHSPETFPNQADDRFLYLTSRNIRDSGLDLSVVAYVSERDHKDIYSRCDVQLNDVLLTKDGAGTGNCCLNTLQEPFSLLSSVCVLRSRAGVLDARYLLYFLQSTEGRQQITGQMTGAAIKRIILRTIKQATIPLPPLEEQRRIVTVLDEAFAAIATATANAEQNLANARELFEAAARTAIEANLTAGSFHTFAVEALAEARKGSMRTGPFGSQLLHSEFVNDGVAVLGIDNAVENKFRWGKRRFITEEKFQSLSRFLVHPGDVIITIMGTCGRCAIIPDDVPRAINSKHLFCISLDQSRCLPKYLHAYFLHAPDARAYLEERAQGSIMAGLNMGIIREMPVRLPSLVVQENLVRAIEVAKHSAGTLTGIYQRKLVALAALKQSLLHRAFTGELTATMPETLAA